MSEDRKSFTFIWKIRNFEFSYGKYDFHSPLFPVKLMGRGMFRLYLIPDSGTFQGCVACYIYRESICPGPNRLEVDSELSFISFDGSVLQSEKFLRTASVKGAFDTKLALSVKREEIYKLKKHLFIPDGVFTICCRIWDTTQSMSQSGRCFAETRLETECRSFVGTIEKFSDVESGGKYPLCIKPSLTRNILPCINLRVDTNGKLEIEIQPVNSVIFSVYKCTFFVLDVFGNKVRAGKGEFRDKNLQCIPVTLLKEHLVENKEYYLPNNVLTIECEIVFPSGSTTERIYEPEYGFDNQDIRDIISETTTTEFSSKEYYSDSLTTLKDDLISLFREGVFSDTKLKTATETFPVHISVLSARSAVFKSMFTSDMKEKTNHCVDIDDLDANTVRRMLLYMYSDTLDDLDYESASKLYFASDKYNIASLKYQCSSFLKQNILLTNCCDILLLADRHQDKYLKSAVHDYIVKNDEAVLFSDEWKDLEKNHPQLTIEALRTVYMKNRKS